MMTERERPWRIAWYGDAALDLRCADTISDAASARVHGALDALRRANLDAVADLVPGYVGLTVLLRPERNINRVAFAAQIADLVAAADAKKSPDDARTVTIPVAYGGDNGPDLAVVCKHAGMTSDALIDCHAGAEYRVAFVGFLPGFPYLIGLPSVLAMPRRATPRTRVPAGSVAIGGAQTGVYPVVSPGGWHLIGRTAARLFDPASAQPALLRAGDRVKFRPVPAPELSAVEVEIVDA